MTQRTIIAITALLIVVSAISTTGCKKYPEGPGFTLLSVKKRLYRPWTLEKYEVDGTDSSSVYSQVDYYYWFRKEGTYNHIFFLQDLTTSGGIEMDWEWTIESEVFQILSFPLNPSVQTPLLFKSSWRIVRLTKNDLIIESVGTPKHIRISFQGYDVP